MNIFTKAYILGKKYHLLEKGKIPPFRNISCDKIYIVFPGFMAAHAVVVDSPKL